MNPLLPTSEIECSNSKVQESMRIRQDRSFKGVAALSERHNDEIVEWFANNSVPGNQGLWTTLAIAVLSMAVGGFVATISVLVAFAPFLMGLAFLAIANHEWIGRMQRASFVIGISKTHIYVAHDFKMETEIKIYPLSQGRYESSIIGSRDRLVITVADLPSMTLDWELGDPDAKAKTAYLAENFGAE